MAAFFNITCRTDILFVFLRGRYTSFAMVSGHPAAFLTPVIAAFFNVTSMPGHIGSGKQRYGNAFLDYAARVPAIVPGLWPAVSRAEADKFNNSQDKSE